MGDDLQSDRTYHGLPEPDESDGRRIVVEEYGGGPTERETAERLYELTNQYGYYGPHAFWWGYRGSNAQDCGHAILDDAIGPVPHEMLNAFLEDVVAHLGGDEWWLNRKMILRWARGWCAEHKVSPASVSSVLVSGT